MNREERIQSLIQKTKKINEIREIKDLKDYNKSLQLQGAAEVIALKNQNPYYGTTLSPTAQRLYNDFSEKENYLKGK